MLSPVLPNDHDANASCQRRVFFTLFTPNSGNDLNAAQPALRFQNATFANILPNSVSRIRPALISIKPTFFAISFNGLGSQPS